MSNYTVRLVPKARVDQLSTTRLRETFVFICCGKLRIDLEMRRAVKLQKNVSESVTQVV